MKLFSSKQAILIYPAGLAWFEIGYMCGTGCQSAGDGVQCVDSTVVPAAWLQVSLYTPCHCSPHSFAHILQIQRKETHKKRVFFYNSASASTLICSLTKSGSNPFQNTVIRKGPQVLKEAGKKKYITYRDDAFFISLLANYRIIDRWDPKSDSGPLSAHVSGGARNLFEGLAKCRTTQTNWQTDRQTNKPANQQNIQQTTVWPTERHVGV